MDGGSIYLIRNIYDRLDRDIRYQTLSIKIFMIYCIVIQGIKTFMIYWMRYQTLSIKIFMIYWIVI
jgi:hypothetical protein